MATRKSLTDVSTLFRSAALLLSLLAVPSLLWADGDSKRQRSRSEIHLQVGTNGYDADTAPGPAVPVGDTVIWEFWVTNTGVTALANVTVFDSQVGAVSCPRNHLEPGEFMICYALGVAIEGLYQNSGTASGTDTMKRRLVDSDSSHYHGVSDD